MAAIEAQPEKPDTSSEKPATSPRKRRRRAAATGAADDCFACQDRQRKCDRKRPYCTQCLDYGKDCSGYKTALTWNIGVASRGKLRGLSLPIAKSKKVEQSPEPKVTKKEAASSHPAEPSSSQKKSPGKPQATLNDTEAASHNFAAMNHASATSPMLPPPHLTWPRPLYRSYHDAPTRSHKRVRPHSLRPIDVSTYRTVRGFEGMPMSAHALGGYADYNFGVTVECSPTASSFAGFEPSYEDLARIRFTENPAQGNSFTGKETFGWPRDNMSSSLSSDRSSRDCSGDETLYADPIVVNTLDEILSAQPALESHVSVIGTFSENYDSAENAKFRLHDQSTDLVADDCGAHSSLTLSNSHPSLPIGNYLCIPHLIDYFDKTISPVIFAFDGLSNPYGTHILRFALESGTLRHAIAALSASNLRQRKTYNTLTCNRNRQSFPTTFHDQSVSRDSMIDSRPDQCSQFSLNEPSWDELYYKSSSIKSLNEQLVDPTRVLDDSILATLLILCLYHVYDTGVAKFKTQFAEVEQILAVRGGDNSKAINWLTVMFTWFDTRAATVNVQQGQLSDDDIDVSTGDGEEWAPKNLAGCDARLFKIISKLGRLKALSQNRPVREEPSRKSSAKMGPIPRAGAKTQDYYSMNCKRLPGNERPLKPDKATALFWKERNEIRHQLQDWHLPACHSTDDSESPDRLDLSHICETFRYSALLYLDHLIHPYLPSAYPQLQTLVKPALYHISQVKSDISLLWSLFNTGPHSVSKEQGSFMIRQRCLDIKHSGVFNNISCLEVLKRTWRDDDVVGDDKGDCIEYKHGHSSSHQPNDDGGMVNNSPQYQHIHAPQPSQYGLHHPDVGMVGGGHGFKWRKAMERVNGEYIVV